MAHEYPRRSYGHRPTFSGATRNSTSLTHRRPFRQPTGALPANADLRKMPHEVPNPSHRHGTPSGGSFAPVKDLVILKKLGKGLGLSWICMFCKEKENRDPDAVKKCPHEHPDDKHCWCAYPQSLYPNWTHVQQKASRITEAAKDSQSKWIIHPLVVNEDGIFKPLDAIRCEEWKKSANNFWKDFRLTKEETNGCRVHALFVDHMAGPVMQMLGAKYNIEPFFFSSSFGWIPTQYQESVVPNEGDHITITLTFVRCISDPFSQPLEPTGSVELGNKDNDAQDQRNIAIKTNEYLWLDSSEQLLFSDIISLHMIRDPKKGNTIISYHAPRKFRATTAKQLCDRFRLTGRSVYWSQIFARSRDPTFTFLSLLWYALYAWDESLEALYNHLCTLESKVIEDNDLVFTQELHRIRAHLLHYASLLEDFKKTVKFVRDTHHPALDNEEYFTPKESQASKDLMHRECTNLLNQIQRLELARTMQNKRLTNVMQLGFSTVNIEDSKRMHKLTQAAVRDSAAMKQIAYLTMIFLPASFVATAFGMNVTEINSGSTPTLSNYFAAALPLTAVTIWIVVALQIQIEDKPSHRHRTPVQKPGPLPPTLPQISDEIIQSPISMRHPHRAYTTSGGEIILDNFKDHDIDDDEDDGDDDGIEDSHGIAGRYAEFKNSSLMKRLAWPVSLTQAAYTQWQTDRKKRRRRRARRTSPQQPETDNMQEGGRQGGRGNLIQSLLPMYFHRNERNAGPMTEAARYAEDVRSQHSSSRAKGSESNSSFPKPILKGKGRATDTVNPVESEE